MVLFLSHLGVDDKADPGDSDKEAAGDVDLVDQGLVFPLQLDLEAAGRILSRGKSGGQNRFGILAGPF